MNETLLATAASERSRPDALQLPYAWVKGASSRSRLDSILDPAEEILGVKNACARHQGGFIFVAPDIEATLFFPKSHPLADQPRYMWVAHPDGSRRGFLVPEAQQPQ